MRFAGVMGTVVAFAMSACAVGRPAGPPAVAGTQAALVSYDEAMQEPVVLGDATETCPETQLRDDQVVTVMDAQLDQMVRECVATEARRAGRVPGTVTIDLAILGDGTVQGATVSPGTRRFRRCIGGIVEKVRFPKFASPRMGARYQFHTS